MWGIAFASKFLVISMEDNLHGASNLWDGPLDDGNFAVSGWFFLKSSSSHSCNLEWSQALCNHDISSHDFDGRVLDVGLIRSSRSNA